MTNEEILDKYKYYLKRYKDLGEISIRNYMYSLGTFEKFVNKPLLEVVTDDINNYLDDLKWRLNNKPSRLTFAKSVLSQFYKYLNRNKYMAYNPIEGSKSIKIKVKKEKDKDVLSSYQLFEIRRKLKEYGDIELECFFALLMSSMPVKQALIEAKWKDIDYENNCMVVKLDEEHNGILYFDDYTNDTLVRLRKERRRLDRRKPTIFITRYNNKWNKISNPTINVWLNKIKDICGLDYLTMQLLKRSTVGYMKNVRYFSEEKVNLIKEHRMYLRELEDVVQEEKNKIINKEIK